MPYVNPHLIFTIFRGALLTCFTTSNRPGMLYLYEVMPEKALQDWKLTPATTPGTQDYSQDVKEFKHSSDLLVCSSVLSTLGAVQTAPWLLKRPCKSSLLLRGLILVYFLPWVWVLSLLMRVSTMSVKRSGLFLCEASQHGLKFLWEQRAIPHR